MAEEVLLSLVESFNPGDIFSRLTFIRHAGANEQNRPLGLFRCECGREPTKLLWDVFRRATKSCGCLKRTNIGVRSLKHGHTKNFGYSPEYQSWMAMLQRCNDPKKDKYHRYGGRGISVCERWSDFANFLTDMGPRLEGKSLDRIDNDKNYEPGNCRWATKLEQMNNRECTQFVEYQGRTQSLQAWAREFNIKPQTLRGRIVAKWPLDMAFSTPNCRGKKLKNIIQSKGAIVPPAPVAPIATK